MATQGVGETTGYINAGGRGTRLNSIFPASCEYGVPKALLELGDPPVKLIDHHISDMASTALRNIIVGSGDVAPVYEYASQRYASIPGIDIVSTQKQHGTAGDLVVAHDEFPKKFGKHILIKNVDTFLDIDDSKFIGFHESTGNPLSIALTSRSDVPNKGAYRINHTGKVIYCAEVTPIFNNQNGDGNNCKEMSSTGAIVLDTELLDEIRWSPEDGQLSLYKDVVGYVLARYAVSMYDNAERFFRDVGTVSAWRRSEQSQEIEEHINRTDLAYLISQRRKS